MNKEIVFRHNLFVSLWDDVYVLGDLCLGADDVYEDNKRLIESLNGRLHIVLGNHDSQKRIEMYKTCKNVVEICGYATMLKYKKYIFYISHYPTLTSNFDNTKPLKAKTINLCGHGHVEDKFADIDKGLIYHVEMDAHSCYPIALDDIIEQLKYRYLEV
jgi:calcineurin-like phosphoesterase family protein